MEIKSRILQYLNKDLLVKLNSIALDVLIPSNNEKVDLMIQALTEHNVTFSELGPGTNRLAILIDGYVFKIGLDKAGIIDNWAEFSLAQELQPFVTKCYECNGLIAVAEYITVISKDEFQNSKEEVRQILSHLADSYLLGDVGSVSKNFMNWGYRADGSLVILDYAYVYRVIGDELLCGGLNKDETTCTGSLEYDENFHKLICPRCRKTYTFHEIRRKISKEYEEKERETIKSLAYKVTKPIQEFNRNIDQTTIVKNINEGDNTIMNKRDYEIDNECISNEVQYDEDTYAEAIEFMKNINNTDDSSCENTSDNGELIKDISLVDDAVDVIDDDITDNEKNCDGNCDDCDDFDCKNTPDDDDDDFTAEDIMSIVNHESAIEDEVNEMEDEEECGHTNDNEPEFKEATPIGTVVETDDNVEINTGSIVPTDVVDDYFEDDEYESDEEFDCEDEPEVKYVVDTVNTCNEESTSDNESVEEDNITVITEVKNSPAEIDITVNTSDNQHATVKLEVGEDTIVLTTPDKVDEMRSILSADLATEEIGENDDDDYEDYEDDLDSSFTKIPKKKKRYE